MADLSKSRPMTDATRPMSQDIGVANISDVEKLSKHSTLAVAHTDTRSPDGPPNKKVDASQSPPARAFAANTNDSVKRLDYADAASATGPKQEDTRPVGIINLETMPDKLDMPAWKAMHEKIDIPQTLSNQKLATAERAAAVLTN